MSTSKLIAEKLLQIKAIKLQPTNPFTWASGWKSPIYCDNRKTLSYPAVRDVLKKEFAVLLQQKYGKVDLIAGVATGAIAIGVLVADYLNIPFVYIRSSSKAHGLENKIEGHFEAGQRVVVIEDLVSTGGSSLKAVEALRNAKCEVLGMLAIFTYGLDVAKNNFEQANCELTTLSNYHQLLEQATETGYITDDALATLHEWRKDPANWNPSS